MAKKTDPTANLTQALKDAIHGEQAPEEPEALVKALVATPDKAILVDALRAKTGGRVVLKRGSEEIDEAQTVAFIRHVAAVGVYDQPKFMGQRIRPLSEITQPALVSDPFYAAAHLPAVSLTAAGVNPVSGTAYPVNDADAMERIAFVAARVKVGDATDGEEVQPIVDMVTGAVKPPRKKVAGRLKELEQAIARSRR